MKKCPKCGLEKSHSEFSKRGRSLHSVCKKCDCERAKRWREANPEKYYGAIKRWVANNPEKAKELVRKANVRYRTKHPDKIKAIAKKRYAEHRDELKAKRAQHRNEHPEIQKLHRQRYYEKHKERLKGYIKSWIASNPEKKRAHGIAHRAFKAGKILRSPCSVCGEPGKHMHHTDYSKPLDITWLCHRCHSTVHYRATHES